MNTTRKIINLRKTSKTVQTTLTDHENRIDELENGNGGSNNSLEIFTKAETIVGKWIDGNNIYRQVFEGIGYFFQDEKPIASILGLKNIIEMKGEINTGDGVDFSNSIGGSNGISFFKRIREEIYLYNNAYDDSSEYFLILKYTKTSK